MFAQHPKQARHSVRHPPHTRGHQAASIRSSSTSEQANSASVSRSHPVAGSDFAETAVYPNQKSAFYAYLLEFLDVNAVENVEAVLLLVAGDRGSEKRRGGQVVDKRRQVVGRQGEVAAVTVK